MNFRKSVIAIILAALLLLPLAGFAGDFNYGEALQKAIFFYDAQRAGRLPERGTGPG